MSDYRPPSKAQCQQRYDPDSDHQHCKRNGIVIEPMPTLYTHDAALPYEHPQLSHFFPGPRAGDGFLRISRAKRSTGSTFSFRWRKKGRPRPKLEHSSSTSFPIRGKGPCSNLLEFLNKSRSLG